MKFCKIILDQQSLQIIITPLLQILNTLSSIADRIMGSSAKLKNQKSEQLIRTADTLEAISDCINKITHELSKKDEAGIARYCQELGFYLKNFNSLNLGAILGNEKIQLLEDLDKAVSMRRAHSYMYNSNMDLIQHF